MGNSFDVEGTFKLSSTGRSIAVELEDRIGKIYLSLNDIDKVASGKKTNGTVYSRKLFPSYPAYNPE